MKSLPAASAMLLMISWPLPLFIRSTVWGELTEPTDWSLNCRSPGLKVTAGPVGAAVTVNDRETLWFEVELAATTVTV
jgi:hypothetical protein